MFTLNHCIYTGIDIHVYPDSNSNAHTHEYDHTTGVYRRMESGDGVPWHVVYVVIPSRGNAHEATTYKYLFIFKEKHELTSSFNADARPIFF